MNTTKKLTCGQARVRRGVSRNEWTSLASLGKSNSRYLSLLVVGGMLLDNSQQWTENYVR